MALIKRKHLNLYKKYVEAVISDLGQSLTIILPKKEQRCNNCKYDFVHKCSSGVYNGTGPKPFTGAICPVCKSKGVIVSTSEKNIIATCRWVNYSKTENMERKEKYGKEEDKVLKVKTKVVNYDDMKDAEYYEYDGERYKLLNIIKRGMKENVVCVAYLEKENV